MATPRLISRVGVYSALSTKLAVGGFASGQSRNICRDMYFSLVTNILTISCAIVSLNTALISFSSPSEVHTTANGRVRGARNRTGKDFVLGGLFPIHNAAVGGGECGIIRKETGLERMEAMLYAVDIINAGDSLLSGLTLGYDIRDTCSSENIGLDESIDLVITNSQLDIESCQVASLLEVNNTELDAFQGASTAGVVGASNSGVSVPVAGLLRLFTTPQISYASSSALLNNRNSYSYFYRTTPPDTLQAQAMVDLLLYFNWTYISTIYSQDTYGEPGIDELHALAEKSGICIDLNEGIDSSFSDEQFNELAQKVVQSEANVIILFSSEHDAIKLFKQLQPIYTRNFTWIASDFWARSLLVLDSYSSILLGMIGFVPQTKFTQGFLDYFSSLTLESNQRNPWFEEWYTDILGCSITGNRSTCQRNLSVPEQLNSYEQGQKVPLVIDAVYAFAHALNNFLADNCEQPLQWFRNNRTCFNQRRELNGSTLLEYIQRVNFTSPTGNRVTFDNQGNVPGKYEILNFQTTAIGEPFSLESLGTWSNLKTGGNSLQLLPLTEFQFGYDNVSKHPVITVPESQCSRCQPGHFRRQVQSSCCGICDPCLGQQFSNTSIASNCSVCDDESWGNNPMVGSNSCVSIQESFLSFRHPYSIIIMIIAVIGLIAVVFTSIVFGIQWTTPVVKSSGREQMIILLVGISLSYISAFFYVSPPLPTICGFQRWTFWTSFSIMFGALLVKVIRVARIFLQNKSLKKPRFTEPHYQVLFTAAIVAVQWIILIISTSVNQPEVLREVRIDANMPNAFPTLVITCLREHIGFLTVSVAYQSLLICLCTILGALSFKYPENFNEAKYIALCSMSILVIWIAFIITFFATQDTQELQNITISLAVVMSGYAVLLSIFGPKLYISLFKSGKNTQTQEFYEVGPTSKGMNNN